MSARTPKEELQLKAAELAQSAPVAWRNFLVAFGNYTETQVMACVGSSVTEVQVTQGMARSCVNLGKIFSEAVTSADRLRS